MTTVLKHLKRDRRGTASVEYGFICACIVLAMLGAISGFAEESTSMWTSVKDKSQEAIDEVN
jgi:pilus assembly protein Flp/PilA